MQSSYFRNALLFKQHFYTELNTQGPKRMLYGHLNYDYSQFKTVKYFFHVVPRTPLKGKVSSRNLIAADIMHKDIFKKEQHCWGDSSHQNLNMNNVVFYTWNYSFGVSGKK